jgi:two-component system chemotaxis response regulator CheB
VLSGNLDDGSAGLLAVRRRGGIAIVQDPSNASVSEMPQKALEYAGADYTLPTAEIGPKLVELINSRDAAMNKPKKKSNKGGKSANRKNGKPSDPEVREHEEDITNEQGNGKPSVFACPECHGVLWEVDEGRVSRFRCRVGHAFSADSLKSELSEGAERALWAAMRALEEKAAMTRRLSSSAKGPKDFVERLQDQAASDAANAEVIRKIIFDER